MCKNERIHWSRQVVNLSDFAQEYTRAVLVDGDVLVCTQMADSKKEQKDGEKTCWLVVLYIKEGRTDPGHLGLRKYEFNFATAKDAKKYAACVEMQGKDPTTFGVAVLVAVPGSSTKCDDVMRFLLPDVEHVHGSDLVQILLP